MVLKALELPQAGPAEPWIRGEQVPRLLLQHEPGGGETAECQLCSPHFTWVPPVLLHPPETVHCPVSTLRDRVSSVRGDGRPIRPACLPETPPAEQKILSVLHLL